MGSVASLTLQKARTFVAQARSAEPHDRDRIATNLEAGIVFSRSVTFHLQSQFAHAPGFAEWYAEQQNALRSRPVCRFMLDQRNYVLKVGPTQVHRVVNVELIESVHAHAEITVQVVRGQPWYRRSPRILLDDLVYPLRQRVRIWLERRARRRRLRQSAPPAAMSATQDDLYFINPEWSEVPALDLLEQHLSLLAAIVREAESRFVASSGEPHNAA